VVISAVDASADAAAKGLQRGDIVLSANYKPVATTADLEAVVRQAKAENREAVLLRIQRRGQPPVYMPIRLR
jgi:serine protease Do